MVWDGLKQANGARGRSRTADTVIFSFASRSSQEFPAIPEALNQGRFALRSLPERPRNIPCHPCTITQEGHILELGAEKMKMGAESNEIPPRRYLERQPFEDDGYAEAYRTWVANGGATPQPPFPTGAI